MNIPTGVNILPMKDTLIKPGVKKYPIGDDHIAIRDYLIPKKDESSPKGDEDFIVGVNFTPDGNCSTPEV